jgi:hypothetical protein
MLSMVEDLDNRIKTAIRLSRSSTIDNVLGCSNPQHKS